MFGVCRRGQRRVEAAQGRAAMHNAINLHVSSPSISCDGTSACAD